MGADELERTGTRAVLELRPHARARARDRIRPRAAARRGRRDRARVRRAARGRPRAHRPAVRGRATRSSSPGSGCPAQAPPGLRADELLPIMARDKKSGGGLTFVLVGAERNRTGRRTRPGRGAQGVRRGRSGGVRPDGDDPAALGTEPEPARRARAAVVRHDDARRARRVGGARPRPSSATSSSTCSRTTRACSIDAIHGRAGDARRSCSTPGAFSHYAYALADALATVRGRQGRGAPLEPLRRVNGGGTVR